MRAPLISRLILAELEYIFWLTLNSRRPRPPKALGSLGRGSLGALLCLCAIFGRCSPPSRPRWRRRQQFADTLWHEHSARSLAYGQSRLLFVVVVVVVGPSARRRRHRPRRRRSETMRTIGRWRTSSRANVNRAPAPWRTSCSRLRAVAVALGACLGARPEPGWRAAPRASWRIEIDRRAIWRRAARLRLLRMASESGDFNLLLRPANLTLDPARGRSQHGHSRTRPNSCAGKSPREQASQ